MANILGIQVPPIRSKEEAENILRQTRDVRDALGGLDFGDMSDYGKMRDYMYLVNNQLDLKRGYANAKSDAEREAFRQRGLVNRKTAEDIGIDISTAADQYNADEYGEYQKALQNQIRNKVLYRKHPDEIAAKIYTDYLKQGVDEGTARRRTIAEVMPYATQYESMARYSMNDYGVKDGAMTNAAGQILTGMNPKAAQIYSALYLTPADMRQYGEKRQQMYDMADIAQNNAKQNHEYQIDLMNNQGKWKSQFAKEQHGYNMDTLFKQYEVMSKAEQEAIQRNVQMLKNAGFGDREAWAAALQIGLKGNGNTSQGKSGNGNNGKYEIEQRKIIYDRMRDIEKNANETDNREEYLKNNAEYQALMASLYPNGQATSKVDYSDYDLAISEITKRLQENFDKGNRYSKEGMISLFKQLGMNDNAIKDADWDHYFPVNSQESERRKRQSGYNVGEP